MSELKPCPFCGGEAQMGVNRESTVREYFVGCMNCHIRLYKIGYRRFYTEAEAITAWNTRAERTCRNKVIEINKNTPLEWRTDNFSCSECGAMFFADSEHVNYPIDWAYCPNCGAKVVGE